MKIRLGWRTNSDYHGALCCTHRDQLIHRVHDQVPAAPTCGHVAVDAEGPHASVDDVHAVGPRPCSVMIRTAEPQAGGARGAVEHLIRAAGHSAGGPELQSGTVEGQTGDVVAGSVSYPQT